MKKVYKGWEVNMAVHGLTVKEIVSRVRQAFPNAPENYIINLINDALVDLGKYNSKIVTAKINAVEDQMYYDLSDVSEDSSNNKLELNKILQVFILDNEDDYIKIPRLLNTDLLLADASSESKLETPDSK